MFDASDELLAEFVCESEELLADIEQQLLALSSPVPQTGRRPIERVLRALHHVQVFACSLRLSRIEELACNLGNVLDLVCSGGVGVTTPVLQVILPATATLVDLIDDAAHSNDADVSAHVVALNRLAEGAPALTSGTSLVAQSEATTAPATDTPTATVAREPALDATREETVLPGKGPAGPKCFDARDALRQKAPDSSVFTDRSGDPTFLPIRQPTATPPAQRIARSVRPGGAASPTAAHHQGHSRPARCSSVTLLAELMGVSDQLHAFVGRFHSTAERIGCATTSTTHRSVLKSVEEGHARVCREASRIANLCQAGEIETACTCFEGFRQATRNLFQQMDELECELDETGPFVRRSPLSG